MLDADVPLMLEKPLASTLAECAEVVERVRAPEVVLMCGLLERLNPAVRTAADISRNPLHVATKRHSPLAERTRTGVAGNLLTHEIDMVVRLFGSIPDRYSCSIGFFEPPSDSGSEDVADATLGFFGCRIVSLPGSRIAQAKILFLMISELGRTVEVDFLLQSITVYRDAGLSSFHEDAGYTRSTIIDTPVIQHLGEPPQLQLHHFIDPIRGEGGPATEREGLLAPDQVLHRLAERAGATG